MASPLALASCCNGWSSLCTTVSAAAASARELHVSEDEARRRIWLVDSKGLVTATRSDFSSLAHHKVPYAHPSPGAASDVTDLLDAVTAVGATALVGVSAQGGTFTKAVVEQMSANAEHPLVFALSNPTSKVSVAAIP